MPGKAMDVSGLVLAGGKARRMGGKDKGLIRFEGRPVAASIAGQLNDQCGTVFINANRNRSEYARLGYEVIADSLEDYQGPLAGILAGLEKMKSRWLVTAPCDGPWIAPDYVARMLAAAERNSHPLAVACSENRLQPVHALIEGSLLGSLRSFLQGEERKIDRWYGMHEYSKVDYSDCPRMFLNFNTPQQLQEMS